MAESGPRTIGDLLSANDGADAYRQAQLARLETCLADAGPLVARVHGPDGCGKSSLLQVFRLADSWLRREFLPAFDYAVADVLLALDQNGIGDGEKAEVAAILESRRPAVMGSGS